MTLSHAHLRDMLLGRDAESLSRRAIRRIAAEAATDGKITYGLVIKSDKEGNGIVSETYTNNREALIPDA